MKAGAGVTVGELVLPPDNGRIAWPSQSRAGELALVQVWESQKADPLSHHDVQSMGSELATHYLLECMKGSVLKPE